MEQKILPAPQNKKSILLEFLAHISVGTGIFVIIFASTIGINYLVILVEHNNVDPFICGGLKFTEYVIFVVDTVSYVVFLIISSIKFIIKLFLQRGVS